MKAKEKFKIDFDYECKNFDAITANKNLLKRYKESLLEIQSQIKNECQNDYVTTVLKLKKANYFLKLFLICKENYAEFAKIQDMHSECKHSGKTCNLSCGPGDFYEGGKCDLKGCYTSKL